MARSLIAPEPEPALPPREAEGGEVGGAEEGGGAKRVERLNKRIKIDDNYRLARGNSAVRDQ